VAGGDLPADVVESFLGIAPTEGRFMARLGGTMSCSPGEMALTARITPPAGATRLLLDYNVLGRTARLNWGGGGREFPPIVARLQVPRGLVELTLGRPAVTELTTELEGGFGATGWRTLRMEVHSAPGEAILTLRARPSFVGPPPPLCVPGVLLLDNLRFE